MQLFRCFIRGDNFPGKILGQRKPIGFYTTRYVEADSPEAAELAAVDLLRKDADLQVAGKFRTEDARIYFEHIEEVPIDAERKPNSGFTFFAMDT